MFSTIFKGVPLKKDKLKPEDKNTSKKVYTLKVSLMNGPVTDQFVEENPEIVRTIKVLGTNTLEDLHDSIFEAFDRNDEHMYEFQTGGKFNDENNAHYVHPLDEESIFASDNIRGKVTRTKLNSMDLITGDIFYYWFDFGDDWIHEIEVVAIEDEISIDKYPKITGRIGNSPPQYPDWDEDEDEYDEDDEEYDDEEEFDEEEEDDDEEEDNRKNRRN